MFVASRRRPITEALQIGEDWQAYVVGASEQLLREFTLDFSELTPALLVCRLVALTQQSGGASGVYRVRIGGTPGAADGTEVATLNVTNAAYPSTPDSVIGGSFANPVAKRLVKVTGNASIGGATARIRGVHLVFESA